MPVFSVYTVVYNVLVPLRCLSTMNSECIRSTGNKRYTVYSDIVYMIYVQAAIYFFSFFINQIIS